MSESFRTVMVYSGGKYLLADWIVENLPEHEIYVEPFGGAASVLMRKLRSTREVYNDLNTEIVNVFRVLRDELLSAKLEHQLRLTPFSREEVRIAKWDPVHEDSVERARRTIVCAFMSRSRQSRDGAGMRFSKLTNRPFEKDWVNYADSIAYFTKRLRGVMVENKSAVELIKFWDSETTLFYCDPPYVHSSRKDKSLYAHEMDDQDHEELISVLKACKGMVVLSGYPSPLYGKELGDWRTVDKETKTAQHRPVTERLWLNRAAGERAVQISLGI